MLSRSRAGSTRRGPRGSLPREAPAAVRIRLPGHAWPRETLEAAARSSTDPSMPRSTPVHEAARDLVGRSRAGRETTLTRGHGASPLPARRACREEAARLSGRSSAPRGARRREARPSADRPTVARSCRRGRGVGSSPPDLGAARRAPLQAREGRVHPGARQVGSIRGREPPRSLRHRVGSSTHGVAVSRGSDALASADLTSSTVASASGAWKENRRSSSPRREAAVNVPSIDQRLREETATAPRGGMTCRSISQSVQRSRWRAACRAKSGGSLLAQRSTTGDGSCSAGERGRKGRTGKGVAPASRCTARTASRAASSSQRETNERHCRVPRRHLAETPSVTSVRVSVAWPSTQSMDASRRVSANTSAISSGRLARGSSHRETDAASRSMPADRGLESVGRNRRRAGACALRLPSPVFLRRNHPPKMGLADTKKGVHRGPTARGSPRESSSTSAPDVLRQTVLAALAG
jgi:hypothetical protein